MLITYQWQTFKGLSMLPILFEIQTFKEGFNSKILHALEKINVEK